MTTKQKTVNYTDAQVKKMTAIYQAAKDNYPATATEDEKFALRNAAMKEIEAFTGKTIPSIRSKLGVIGIYEGKPETVKSSTGKRITKRDLVDTIADNGNQRNDKFFDSLEGANKTVLEYIISLQNQLVNALDTLAMPEVVETLHELAIAEVELEENISDDENESHSDDVDPS